MCIMYVCVYTYTHTQINHTTHTEWHVMVPMTLKEYQKLSSLHVSSSLLCMSVSFSSL